MNISIFGLGYVGCVGVACFSKEGHKVIGVDINPLKVELINSGKPTIVEKDVDVLIKDGYEKNLISATSNHLQAVLDTEVSFICVGTPNDETGHLDISYIIRVTEQICEGLKLKNGFHTIAVRSTVPPGTIDRLIDIIEQRTKKKHNVDFAVVMNPEFLREGTAVDDFYNPPMTVIGSVSTKGIEVIKSLYSMLSAETYVVETKIAEMIKLVSNSFHALKIAFANEVGNIAKRLNIDSHQMMDLFCKDTKLNISAAYLKPGFAYGGSCLPKDLRALEILAYDLYLSTPLISSINQSNDIQKNLPVKFVEKSKCHKIGIVGLTFKQGTDDLRYSPMLSVVEQLIGKGYEVRIFDESINLSALIGVNREHLLTRIPHISKLLSEDLESVIEWSELLLVNMRYPSLSELIENKTDLIILDLINLDDLKFHKGYNGLAWR
ncbi:MAG: nucleotide sugar dehydrogenase [Ignavibacteria bacterium]